MEIWLGGLEEEGDIVDRFQLLSVVFSPSFALTHFSSNGMRERKQRRKQGKARPKEIDRKQHGRMRRKERRKERENKRQDKRRAEERRKEKKRERSLFDQLIKIARSVKQ